MGAFELNNTDNSEDVLAESGRRRIKEECIIALKVYDSCRQQDCLDEDKIGPARAAESTCIGDEHIEEGDIVDPPSNAGGIETLCPMYKCP